MFKRLRFKQTKTRLEKLATFAKDTRARAASLPPSQERDDLLRRARQADTASHIDAWVNSPGLQTPR